MEFDLNLDPLHTYVPLPPGHEGNFEGYKVGQKVELNREVTAVAGLELEGTGNDLEWQQVEGRWELPPVHSTAYHPPYDFSHEGEVTRIKYCRTGQDQFVTTSVDGNFHQFSTETMKPSFTCQLDTPLYSLAHSPGPCGPNAELFAVATRAGPIPLLDPRVELPVMKLTGPTAPVLCLAWHPHQTHVVISGGVDAKVRIWDIRIGRGQILDHLVDPQYDDTTPVADLGATVGMAITDKYILTHHHRNLPRAKKLQHPINTFSLKVWDLDSHDLQFTASIPAELEPTEEDNPPRTSTRSSSPPQPGSDPTDPIFYTRQRRARPQVGTPGEPVKAKVKSKQVKEPYTPTWKEISNSALLNHHHLTYRRLPHRNLDPTVGWGWSPDTPAVGLDLPPILLPPHPLNPAGAHLLYDLRPGWPPRFYPLRTAFHKVNLVSFRPHHQEIYMSAHAGSQIMRFASSLSTPAFPSTAKVSSPITDSPTTTATGFIPPPPPPEVDSESDQDNWSD